MIILLYIIISSIVISYCFKNPSKLKSLIVSVISDVMLRFYTIYNIDVISLGYRSKYGELVSNHIVDITIYDILISLIVVTLLISGKYFGLKSVYQKRKKYELVSYVACSFLLIFITIVTFGY